MSYKGRFKPKNPDKYRGNSSNIIYRSLWELKFFRMCDDHPQIQWWSSEEHVIPYLSPIDGKMHRYYPDVVLCKTKEDSTSETIMVEIKPFAQTHAPNPANRNKTKTGRVSRRYLNEVKNYGKNNAKWDSAKRYCNERGWKFIILTEKGSSEYVIE